ncbi:MAG: ribosomal-protein-alanine N-acetyltransferase [Candidatus Staskawiczbacteria bacterium RIFOXYD1_FULL_39_28]|uniref:Ribosomal-protein-alanine N-acetyltransferase n=1 Tax=Candidatus Staskawiczbacteria bacterium RIFOXYC1_FULL_38_18 TaxID=1802229 RepID=A0A1G2JAG3_9BACT|nr:MAG: ribosomal-protein-alanine acetyltransferase [Parcubacteria group bacterium GW2011_GWB1_41_4]OGZ83541.1 MAG: ribosomal-protein-alanine N-acetyltransferase [Candidatus Staskawiczbacteria bacterium RIFOXYC1_FULL_38_18]OGZ92154.1 MAG: ribosomal-protein-alanine N-acetyltransferase [Candidatus Staskawiczbacteria bacterium RIFOXYD1_FULL_39_28]
MASATLRSGLRIATTWLVRKHLPEVIAIENESFEFSWPENDFLCCLRTRRDVGRVVLSEDRVVGFVIYGLYSDFSHVINLAVAPNFRRKGVGSQIITELYASLPWRKRNRIVTEVRERNLAAQLFFRTNGFVAQDVLHNYYDDSPEDAYRMVRRYYKEVVEA